MRASLARVAAAAFGYFKAVTKRIRDTCVAVNKALGACTGAFVAMLLASPANQSVLFAIRASPGAFAAGFAYAAIFAQVGAFAAD